MPFQTHSRGPGGWLGFTIDLLIVSGRPEKKVSQPGWENRINLVGPENAMSRPSRYCWATTTHISWPLSLQSCATTFLGDAPSRWLTGNFDGRSTDPSTDLFRWIASGDLTVCEAIAHWVRWFTKQNMLLFHRNVLKWQRAPSISSFKINITNHFQFLSVTIMWQCG